MFARSYTRPQKRLMALSTQEGTAGGWDAVLRNVGGWKQNRGVEVKELEIFSTFLHSVMFVC